MTTNLLNSFKIRPPLLSDLNAVVDLMNTCTLSIMGRRNFDVTSIGRMWDDDEFQLNTDAWVVTTPDQSIVGYAEISAGDLPVYDVASWVHPAYEGYGIGEALLQAIEDRACRESGSIILDHTWVYEQDRSTRDRLAQSGYAVTRKWYRMQIEMDAPPPAPKLPEGIRLRTLRLDQEEQAVHMAFEEAQADEWGHERLPFGKWKYYFIEAEKNFDPTLWFLAVEDDEIVGYTLCRAERPGDPEEGHVRYVGVRSAWRKRGVALALLQQTFSEFYRRGKRKVGLGVDATSLTGAERLYLRAGMKIYQTTYVYQKKLR